ncbi:MAG: hypothetical protein M1453_06970 [Acidobacteria bacterium]|nr:hypothetical protein [Acidobacteriota bacterium]MCL5287720.1 hypothetical protein [Acidobacteriota bacterium]
MSAPPNSVPPVPGNVPQQKRGSNIWAWVLGLLVVGALILGGGAWVVTHYLVRSLQVNRADSTVVIDTPVGTLKAAKDEKVDPGLPVYPDAKIAQAGGTVELSMPEEDSVQLTAVHYRTIDPIEKVDAWYREQLNQDFKREGPGVMVRKKNISGIIVKSGDIAYVSEKDDVVRVVALQKRFNGVEIALLRAGKQESQ